MVWCLKKTIIFMLLIEKISLPSINHIISLYNEHLIILQFYAFLYPRYASWYNFRLGNCNPPLKLLSHRDFIFIRVFFQPQTNLLITFCHPSMMDSFLIIGIAWNKNKNLGRTFIFFITILPKRDSFRWSHLFRSF